MECHGTPEECEECKNGVGFEVNLDSVPIRAFRRRPGLQFSVKTFLSHVNVSAAPLTSPLDHSSSLQPSPLGIYIPSPDSRHGVLSLFPAACTKSFPFCLPPPPFYPSPAPSICVDCLSL